MEKPPMEWIDKLFNCMETFYGERWTKRYQGIESLAKTVWQSALQGLTHEEIKRALVRFKREAEKLSSLPPGYMELFCYAKGKIEPREFDIRRIDSKGCRSETARKSLADIIQELRRDRALK